MFLKKINTVLLIAFLFFTKNVFSQNCQAYLYYGDTLQYEACIIAEKRAGYFQFARKYQEALDEAIEKCDYFSHAYQHKSTAYLKSGDFITWKKLIDKAVDIDPKEHLFYRGWCRYQFFKDYQGAIDDIERLDSLVDYDIGPGQDGFYHLNIAKALCYKGLGQKEKAIEIIEKQMADKNHMLGLFDNLHLGVLYLEMGDTKKAMTAFNRQSEENELADNQFYIAMTYKKMGDLINCKKHLLEAKSLFEKGQVLFSVYVERADKIYLQEIEAELQKLNEQKYKK